MALPLEKLTESGIAIEPSDGAAGDKVAVGAGTPERIGISVGAGTPDKIGISVGAGTPDKIGISVGSGTPDRIGIISVGTTGTAFGGAGVKDP
jgi:hypothetical protein